MLGKANINILFEAKQVFQQKALCLYVYVDLGHGNTPCSMHSYRILKSRCKHMITAAFMVALTQGSRLIHIML